MLIITAEIVGLRPWNSILVNQKKNWVARACNGRQPSHAPASGPWLLGVLRATNFPLVLHSSGIITF